jgi:hypothetical protein
VGILIFKGLTARRLYKSFGVKGLKTWKACINKTHSFNVLNKEQTQKEKIRRGMKRRGR